MAIIEELKENSITYRYTTNIYRKYGSSLK